MAVRMRGLHGDGVERGMAACWPWCACQDGVVRVRMCGLHEWLCDCVGELQVSMRAVVMIMWWRWRQQSHRRNKSPEHVASFLRRQNGSYWIVKKQKNKNKNGKAPSWHSQHNIDSNQNDTIIKKMKSTRNQNLPTQSLGPITPFPETPLSLIPCSRKCKHREPGENNKKRVQKQEAK